MKVLLDNCVDRNARLLFPGLEVNTAVELGWDRLTNGELIARASKRFDVLVTTDKNMRHQQNLEQLPIPVLELDAATTRFKDLKGLAPYISAALEATRTHRFVSLHADGRIESLAKR